MTVAYREIGRVLDGARRRQVQVVLLAALAFGAAAALLALFAGAAALALGARAWVRAAALLGGAAGAAGAVGWAIRALLRTAWSEEAAARTIACDEPALRSDLVSSVELSRERASILATGRYSVALVDGHVERTAARASALDLARAIPDRLARLGGLALLGVAVLHGVTFLLGGGAFARAYGRMLAGDPRGAAADVLDPITGDVELTYAYPAYMRREPRTLSGTGGEIRAPRGTEVALRTRADRDVKAAEIAVDLDAAAGPDGKRPPLGRYALAVAAGRDLSGRLQVEDGGSYRFRFLDGRGKVVAEGPPIPIAVEPDAFPGVRITRPETEIEVEPNAVVRIEWQAEDDVGLGEVALVLKGPDGEERRSVLRKPEGVRRDGGTHDLDLGPERLGEGDRLAYWLEAQDGDVVSGPKKAVSETRAVKIYSEAEHRREVLERARLVFEELVTLLADRLETLAAGPLDTPDRMVLAEQLDVRTRHLHERMREVAREIRRDRAGPREVAQALENVAAQVRVAQQRVVATRAPVAQAFRIRSAPDRSAVGSMKLADLFLDQELEKGVLYLEQLLDKQRAEDLVHLAKDLAEKRRDLAGLLEKYRAAPTEAARKEVLARISRMKERVKELLARMSEMSRGFNDEHMNQEALAEMSRSQDLVGGLDRIEELLAKGDVEGAMRELDQMASTMDQMLAGLESTAGLPDEKARELMREMLSFKEQLEKVKGEQERTAAETDQVRQKYRDAIRRRLEQAEGRVKALEKLAAEAKKDVEAAQPGVTYRAEPELDQATDALEDLGRALAVKELGSANEAAQRAAPAVERLARFLEEDVALSQQNPAFTRREPGVVREAQRNAARAVPKVREIRDELGELFPDPRSILSPGDQTRLDGLSRRQGELEQKAGDLQRKLAELMQKAPVFPPGAQGELGETRGHMGQAATELSRKNPQRGHGEQELALDALSRFQKGLEEAAKRGKGQGGGMGFPFPFGDAGSGSEEGEGRDPAREKVNIPGAEAYKVPEEFRKDLLDAMKQGAPERYRSEVQRYYEELVR
jgi:transglutaminase-like putative cysteine protease